MRRMIAFATVLTLSLAVVPLEAAPRAPRAQGQAATGTINGMATGAQGQALPNYIVRARNLANGQIAGSTTSNSAGSFSFAGLAPGNYAIEVVSAAGQIVGTSASVAVAAGATASVTVTSSAAAAGAAGVGAASGGISTALIVIGVAAAAGVVAAVVVASGDASPSR